MIKIITCKGGLADRLQFSVIDGCKFLMIPTYTPEVQATERSPEITGLDSEGTPVLKHDDTGNEVYIIDGDIAYYQGKVEDDIP